MPNPKATEAMKKILKQTPVADDGAQIKRFEEPSKSYLGKLKDGIKERVMNPDFYTEKGIKPKHDPSRNLGKFLHKPKTAPVDDGSKDPNAAGSKVRPGF